MTTALRTRSAITTRSFSALGHTFRVQSPLPQVIEFVGEIYDSMPRPKGKVATYRLVEHNDPAAHTAVQFDLYVDGERLCRAHSIARALGILLWHVNQAAVQAAAPAHLLLHAGGAERDGCVVVLPAAMEAGKTTTTAGLLLNGYRYLTDEAVAIDPRTLAITPFPKPLSIDEGSWSVLAGLRPDHADMLESQWQVPPSAFGTDTVSPGGRPDLVISPRYIAGATTEATPVTPGQMAMQLAACTFAFQGGYTRNLEVIARVCERATCFNLTIGNLATAVEIIDLLVDERLMSP